MKITEIRIERTKKLRDYESLKLGFTVNVDPDESATVAVENAQKFLDWQIELDDRTRGRSRRIKELEAIKAKNGTRTEADTKIAMEHAKWIQDFDRRAEEIAVIGSAL